MMAAALAAAVGINGFAFQGLRLLGEAGEGIIFAQNADFGASGAEGAGEGGGNAAEVFGHFKAVLFQ